MLAKNGRVQFSLAALLAFMLAVAAIATLFSPAVVSAVRDLVSGQSVAMLAGLLVIVGFVLLALVGWWFKR